MALRSRLIADPHEVLRIIDDMEDSELSNEDDSETDEEAEISLAVTPVHSDSVSETKTIDSIDPVPSGSGVGSTVIAAATSGNLHPESSSDTDSYGEQQQGVARLTRLRPGQRQRQAGPGEVGLPLQSQDVDVTGPLFTEGLVVDMAGLWLGLQFVLCIEQETMKIFSSNFASLCSL